MRAIEAIDLKTLDSLVQCILTKNDRVKKKLNKSNLDIFLSWNMLIKVKCLHSLNLDVILKKEYTKIVDYEE